MKPHIEEAWKTLSMADRDIHAFNVLKEDGSAHISVVCFHAQQAIEKSLKAVMFSRKIEFRKIHDLVELSAMLRDNDIECPLTDEQFLRLNPFAVTFRYDDLDIESVTIDEATEWVKTVREWAFSQISSVSED